jgi:predicted esterase
MAYISDQDRTLQHYALSLPRDWDPKKAYPLFVELHGAGSENFLGSVARALGPRKEGEDLRNPVQRAGTGYWIMPSGRGNLGYRGPGEGDVWEAYDDVHRLFQIDEDRRYLYGFSMGGGGTWSLGTRTPDRWAALMIMSGGMWRESGDHGLGRNIASVPTYVWCGEEDFISYRYFPRFVEEIERWGGKPVAQSVPGLGHRYTAEIQEESFQWLSGHVRQRPDRFSFVADTDQHLGAWGIRVVRDLTVSGLPVFTCTIEGDTVRIDSEGTPGLEVALGEEGLGLSDEVTVVWNGETAYVGSAETIRLGDYREPRRRP